MNQRLTPIAMETRGVVADWVRASGEVTLYTSTQVPHFVRTFVGVVCGTSEAKVRVVAPDVGGGFGSKLNCYAEEFAACAASRAVGVPVKWIEDRTENVVATIHGRDQRQEYEAGVDENGRVLALRLNAIQNNGAYLQLLTPTISHLTLFMVPGCYDIPQVSISIRQAFTNTTPTDAYRGAGRPEATHGIERLMDAIADDLGLDPADVRRRNFIQAFPYTTATGLSYDSGDYGKALDRALELADYAGFESRRGRLRSRRLPRHRAQHLRRGLRPRAERRHRGDRRRRRRLGELHRPPAPDRQGHGHHGLVAARPGPRDVVVADHAVASSACRSRTSR